MIAFSFHSLQKRISLTKSLMNMKHSPNNSTILNPGILYEFCKVKLKYCLQDYKKYYGHYTQAI